MAEKPSSNGFNCARICVYGCSLLVVFFGIICAYIGLFETESYNYRVDVGFDMATLARDGAPRCDAPMILRNGFKFTPEETKQCESDKDTCIKMVRERVLKVFSEKDIFVYPMDDLATPKKHGVRHIEGLSISVKDFMTSPEYTRHVVHALHQLGNAEEYGQFLDSQGANKNLPEGRSEFQAMRHMPGHSYKGSQIFISRGVKTGSHLHFAWGMNIFFMLSGSKRWIDLHPDYLYQANCSIGHNGYYGHCFPNGYTGEHNVGKVSIDEYLVALKEAGVPDHGIITFTLNPGDILINCDLWGHSIENLTPETVAFSFRYKADLMDRMKWRWSAFQFFRDALVNSLKEKWVNPSSLTFIESLISANEEAVFDDDKRLQGLGVLNQKPESERVDL